MVNESIYETGGGGDMLIINNVIQQTESLHTMAYLLMFSGNREASTKLQNNTTELRLDWWGNDLNDDPVNWINSETERVLVGATQSQKSITDVTNAITKDLRRLKDYGDLTIDVSFLSGNRTQISITITEKKDNKTSIKIVWDATRKEVVLR